MAKITILLPVHNGAQYLRESIQSVLSQDYAEFKLHILDDQSTDAGALIAKSISDPRVQYSLNPERYGLFKTLNRGFEESTTQMVRLWAQDDRMLPGSLRRFIDFADAHPSAGMVYSDFIKIDVEGKRTRDELRYKPQRARTPELARKHISALLFSCYGCLPGNISTVMLRRDAWKRVGGFITGFQQAPDFDMWVRISEEYDVGFIREELIELRDHPLQLGRLGAKDLTTVEEELNVIRRINAILSPVVSQHELNHIWITRRGYQHVHWLMKSVARGDLKTAVRGWRAINRYGLTWQQVRFWLLSLNGRIFVPDVDAIFDSILPLLNQTASSGSRVLIAKEAS